jgi:hypothetical protein
MSGLVLNQYNLPIAAFTKSYLKDLKPAIKARRDSIRAQKDVAAIFRAEKKRKAKELKEAKAAAVLEAKETKAAAAVEKLSDNLKKKSLKLLLWAQKNGYTLKDIVAELNAQIEDKPVSLFYVK